MEKIFEVHPKRPISGVLPNGKRIMSVTRLALSRAEFLRCMHSGTVFAVVNDSRVLVTELDYEKALELFDRQVEFTTKTINLGDIITQPLPANKQDKVEVKPTEPLPVDIANKVEETKEDKTDKDDSVEVKQEVKDDQQNNNHNNQERKSSISSKKKK